MILEPLDESWHLGQRFWNSVSSNMDVNRECPRPSARKHAGAHHWEMKPLDAHMLSIHANILDAHFLLPTTVKFLDAHLPSRSLQTAPSLVLNSTQINPLNAHMLNSLCVHKPLDAHMLRIVWAKSEGLHESAARLAF